MNRYHRWYCSSDRWAKRVRRSLLPWVLGGNELGDEVLEVGPGPGLTTADIAQRVPKLTALEVDERAAGLLRQSFASSPSVTIVHGDGTRMPFDDGCFSAVVSFTMLHHVPSPELQDDLLAEACRVLRPGGVILGFDSTTSMLFRLAHIFDTMVLVDPVTFAGRLQAAGFQNASVSIAPAGGFRFRAFHPA